MAQSIGALTVELNASLAKFQTDLNRATSTIDGFASRAQRTFRTMAAGLLPAVSVAAVAGWTREMIRTAEELQDLSDATGSSIEELSRLSNIARVGGDDFGKFREAVERLAAGMAGAEDGSSKTAEALRFLGVTAQDPARALQEIAEKLDGFADGTGKAALAKDLFGRSGVGFVATLKQIASTSGVVATMTTEQAAEAIRLAEEYRRLSVAVDAVKISVASGLTPAMADLLEQLREGTRLSGGFGQALLDFGLGINPFKSVADNLKDVNAEIEKYREGILASTGAYDNLLERLERQREFLKFQQRQDALRLISPANEDARDILARQKPQLPYTSGRSRTPSGPRDDPTRTLFEGQVDAIRRFAEQEQAVLRARLQFVEAYNDAGLLSFREYFDQKSAAQQEDLRVALDAIDREISARETFKARAGTTRTEAARIDNEIAELRAKRVRAEQDAATQSVLGWFDQSRAAAEYQRQLADVSATLLQLRGDTAGAAALQVRAHNADLRRQFGREGDAGALAMLDDIERLSDTFARLNVAQGEFSRTLAGLAVEQERIGMLRERGALTEIEALGKVSEANRAILATLREQEGAYAALAATLTGPAQQDALAKLEELRLAIERIAQETDLVGDKFRGIFRDSFTDAFASVIDGSKSAKDAILDFAKSVEQMISRIAAQNIAEALFGGAKGGGGAFGGFVGDFFKSLFGGSFANGGFPPVGRWSLVGERGPELIRPLSQTQVIPNHALGGRSVAVTNNFYVSGPMDRHSQAQVAVQAGLGMRRALARDT